MATRHLHVELRSAEIPADDLSADWHWTVIRVITGPSGRTQSVDRGSAATWDDAVEAIREIEPTVPGDASSWDPRVGPPPYFVWRSHTTI